MIFKFAKIIGWLIIYGFVLFQNLGSAVRFKLQILPVLLGVVLYLSRHRSKQYLSTHSTKHHAPVS
ncbi:MAG: hypothetical protein BWK78_00805 [Thiotrichaceae bacterium IS1]|nr:MAG: hypothetical protein BWK78_00805 [Thiotrichaceae bacterium IS1]